MTPEKTAPTAEDITADLRTAINAASAADTAATRADQIRSRIDWLRRPADPAESEDDIAARTREANNLLPELDAADALHPRRHKEAEHAWVTAAASARSVANRLECELEALHGRTVAGIEGILARIAPRAARVAPDVVASLPVSPALVRARECGHRAANLGREPSAVVRSVSADLETIVADIPTFHADLRRIEALGAA